MKLWTCGRAHVPALRLSPRRRIEHSSPRHHLGQNAMFPVPYTQLDLWYAWDTVIIRCKIATLAKVRNVQPIISIVDLRTTPIPRGNRYLYYIQTPSPISVFKHRAIMGTQTILMISSRDTAAASFPCYLDMQSCLSRYPPPSRCPRP